MVTSGREWSLTLVSVTSAFFSGTLPVIAMTIPEMVQSFGFSGAAFAVVGGAGGCVSDCALAKAGVIPNASRIKTIERMGHLVGGVYDTRRGEVGYGLPRRRGVGRLVGVWVGGRRLSL